MRLRTIQEIQRRERVLDEERQSAPVLFRLLKFWHDVRNRQIQEWMRVAQMFGRPS